MAWLKKKETFNMLKDVSAIQEFVSEVKEDLDKLTPLLNKLEELEKEREIAGPSLLAVNLETQAEIIDKLLETYQFFQDDADINGIRVKKISKQFLGRAKDAGLNELVDEKRRSAKWRFEW
jgi:hypothetical protein